jgi:hypothetical protein
MWMNELEIGDMLARYGNHQVVGPAVHTLTHLVGWTNGHSDGWPYWQKPARAADKLMDLVLEHERWDRGEFRHPRPGAEATPAALKLALRPLKAFRTRQAADFVIFETQADIEAYAERRRQEREAAERAELARLQAKYAGTDADELPLEVR